MRTVTQYASPELIDAIAYGRMDPGLDPCWADSGAPTPGAYGRWCKHWCGMACLAMALAQGEGTAPPLWNLLQAALPYGVYPIRNDRSIGPMMYEQFVDYVEAEHGLKAEVHRVLEVDDLIDLLGGVWSAAIVSVHKEIRRPDVPPPGRGGHLVLVTGVDDRGVVSFQNPSGHTASTRQAELPRDDFDRFFAQRGIVLGP